MITYYEKIGSGIRFEIKETTSTDNPPETEVIDPSIENAFFAVSRAEYIGAIDETKADEFFAQIDDGTFDETAFAADYIDVLIDDEIANG